MPRSRTAALRAARLLRIAWVGLDVLILVALTSTAILAWRRDRRVVLPAVATATLLVADAWMDVAMSRGTDLVQSLLLALVIEVPLAALSIVVALRALGDFAPIRVVDSRVDVARVATARDEDEQRIRSA